ncbi:30S ribosomal protein S3 [Patescibacteria group bacterium]|nr:30S ribosomal protein S3 [Patescibacteria group bacterium]MBU4141256.1 30S ribosomal protein S3 [Patescibacteria group bacterium]MBU4339154.1 30S ribosomal protein S3 [Patescibacteria group bacterium]MBU4580597.1 30S ribosomal protein S3 [Patescibacteria group bacterium]
MGHKVNPLLFRLGYTTNWTSRWFGKKNFPEFLKEDFDIRKILAENLKKAAVEKIVIDRASNLVTVSIFSARPGVIIGRGGTGIEDLRKLLKTKLGLKKEVKLDVIEVKDPESSAAIIGQEIASQIERRIGWKRSLKRMLETVMSKKGVQGVKIAISGRLDGAEMGRREWLAKGKIPLHTLRSNIDFTRATAFTTYGAVGIKVWVYKGEMFEEKKREKTIK